MSSGTKPAVGELTRHVAGELLAQIARHRLLQGDVARAAGMSPNQLSGVLNGRKHLDLDQLDKLCWAIGLPFDKIVTEADIETASRHIHPDWDVTALV